MAAVRSAFRIFAVSVTTLGAAGLVFGTTEAADAAAPGQYPVGSSTVALTQPSDNLLGRMTPTADAATQGMYAAQVGWPVIPVNATLAANGHLVTYGTPLNTAVQGGLVYDDWDPAFGTVASAHVPTDSMASYDSFCNNLVSLPDGRMLMVGGNGANSTSNETMYYDPIAHTESMGPGLNRQRWYATALRRPNDQVVVIGGGNYYSYTAYQNPDDNSIVATTPEIGDGSGAWTLLNGATSTTAFGALNNRWWYPRAYNAPDGSIFGISGDQLWRMTTAKTGSIAIVGTLPTSMGSSGSSVMYAPGKILVAGGGEVANGTTTSATNATTGINISGATPVVTALTPMAYKRQWLNLTVLPTGDVFANGGTVVGTNGGADNSSYTAELWNPTTKVWRTAATATRIRTYHSTSVLMPSGAVFTGGGGVPGPEDNFNAEMYYPPYLFTKNASTGVVSWASRPAITSISGSLTWGGTVALGLRDTRRIAAVSLINAGSVTHSENTDQRRVPLSFTQSGSSLSVTLPASVNTAAPGTYLLSVTDGKGVPSASQLVTLRRNAAGTVTVFEPDRSAGRVGPAGTVVPGIVPLTVGSTVSFEAVDNPDVRIRSTGTALSAAAMSTVTDATARANAAFTVRAGLASATAISLESAAQPGYFVTTQGGGVVLARDDGSRGFAGRATWTPKAGLQGNYTSLANYAAPTQYLRKQNGAITVRPFQDTDQFRADATFGVRPPLGPTPGWYAIGNANSALALSVQSNDIGAAAVQDTPSAAVAQEWELRLADDGHYEIADAASGLVLGVQNMSKDPGGAALVWVDNGTADHLWDIVPRDGHWLLRNVYSGLVLGPVDASTTAGAAVQQATDDGTADHLWDFTLDGASAAPGAYTIANVNSGLPLDTAGGDTAHGVGVVQSTASAATTQRWTLADAGNGTFKIFNVGAGQLLGVQGASTDAGADALLWDDNGTADHLWRLVPQNGRWLIVNVNSNLVLGVLNASTDPGVQALQWVDNGTADHLWTLTP